MKRNFNSRMEILFEFKTEVSLIIKIKSDERHKIYDL